MKEITRKTTPHSFGCLFDPIIGTNVENMVRHNFVELMFSIRLALRLTLGESTAPLGKPTTSVSAPLGKPAI